MPYSYPPFLVLSGLAALTSLVGFFAKNFSFIIVTYVSTPRRLSEKTAIMMARIVTMVEMVPTTARPPVEKIAPRSGVSRVVPQVGHPAPRAMSPATTPALPRFSAFCFFFLFQSKTIRPIRIPCKMLIKKIGSQSRKG